ncbi:MAG: serine/threonine-protein kinase [Bryobacteraceae bacterium]
MKPIQIGDVVGDYRVIDIAGSGGAGAVYKIEHIITRRIEAMKLLPPGSSGDPEQVRRFEREIQVQARLHHPNIAALYTAVREGDSIALVMEFVEGESLQRLLEAGPLPVETAVDFASQVLGALAYAHEAGVIHRDVAPANIIVTPDRVAKLTDFGLARGETDLQLSTPGTPLGSPWYMSPEQVKGTVALDPRTDLYAMGAVLHEMLTGEKLFEAEGAFAVMRAHVEAEPAPPSSRNPKVPAALDEIVRKALAKDPAMRFRSADEFRLALESAMAGVGALAEAGARPRLRGLHPSRAAVLVALAPAALVAGYYSIRSLPVTARTQPSANKQRAAAIPEKDDAAPAPATVSQAEPEAPGTVPPAPPEVPAATENPTASARPRTQFPAQATRPARKAERSDVIRVTGGDLQPATPAPPPGPVAPRPAEALGPCVPETNSGEAPEPAAKPAASETAPGLAPEDAAPAKPRKAGNRLVRALEKMNPFHKTAKYDAGEAAKTPADKNQ